MDFLEYDEYFIDLDVDDYNFYTDNCYVKRKIINNNVEIEIINKTGKSLKEVCYSLVTYKDNKPVECKIDYKYFENKELLNGKKCKIRIPLDSDFEDVEVSVIKIK